MSPPPKPAATTVPTRIAVAADSKESANVLRHLADRFEHDPDLDYVLVSWDGQDVGVAEWKSKKKG